MCPDREIISLYLDGELPSPWKEKTEAHLASCPECRAVLARYRNLGSSLGVPSRETIQAAQDRVWKRITVPALVIPGQPTETIPRRTGAVKRAWNRSITLPLPAAAAAAAVIVVVLFLAVTGTRGEIKSMPQNSVASANAGASTAANAVANIGLDDQGIVPAADINGILQYLSSQDNNDIMVIRLPESRNFSRSGEPALINAADYSKARRNLSP